MAHSKQIAGLVGPLMVAIGIAMVVNRNLFPALAVQIARDQGLILLSGILLLLGGIAIVRIHNVWNGGWPIIVTVLGWLAVAGGLARMWFPQLAAPIVAAVGVDTTVLPVGGMIFSALGAFLSYKAYSSDT